MEQQDGCNLENLSISTFKFDYHYKFPVSRKFNFLQNINFVWNFVDFEFDNNLSVTWDHKKRIDFNWTDGGSVAVWQSIKQKSWLCKGLVDWWVTVTSSRSINTFRNVNPSISHSVSERCGENWNWFWQPHYGGMQTVHPSPSYSACSVHDFEKYPAKLLSYFLCWFEGNNFFLWYILEIIVHWEVCTWRK